MFLKIFLWVILPMLCLTACLNIYIGYYLPSTDYRARLKVEIFRTANYLLAGYFLYCFICQSKEAVAVKLVITGIVFTLMIWFRVAFIRYLIRKINFSRRY